MNSPVVNSGKERRRGNRGRMKESPWKDRAPERGDTLLRSRDWKRSIGSQTRPVISLPERWSF